MTYVLGIDIGTGSAKAVAVNLASEPILVCKHYYPSYSVKPGYTEQNPELIWKAFINSLRDTISKLKESPLAICLSSAMHSLIPVDSDCKYLADMITWADARSDDIALRLRASSQGMDIYETTGMPLHAMSPLCKIIWIKENMPDLFERTHKFISIKEYIWYNLFNEFSIDHSIACATGMFDIRKRCWSQMVLELAGITEDKLSKPVNTSYSRKGVGLFKDSVAGLSADTSFVIGASDGCLANLGSFAIHKGVAALTIGTSGAVRIASNKPIYNFEAMTFSYCLDEEIYICGGPVNNGGVVLQWLLKDFFCKTLNDENYRGLFEQIETIKAGSEGLLFLPYLNGERAPIWDAKSCGTFLGIKLQHTQAHFARAVLEGVCYALKDVLIAVEQPSEEIKQINVSGGFVLSQSWMQMLADVTGKKLSLGQTEDASAMGAAFMAMKAMGLGDGNYPSRSENKNEVIIEPDWDKNLIYSQNFLIYKQLYPNLKDTMHQLHLINS